MNTSKLMGAFKVPQEFADLPHYEMNGAYQFLADGCIGILHYDENKVCLNCAKQVVEICGSSLTLHHMGGSEAEVKGEIRMVKFV